MRGTPEGLNYDELQYYLSEEMQAQEAYRAMMRAKDNGQLEEADMRALAGVSRGRVADDLLKDTERSPVRFDQKQQSDV